MLPHALEPLESRRLFSVALAGMTAALHASPLLASDALPVTADSSVVTNTAVRGFRPSQIATAYGLNQIRVAGRQANGAGQTIAVVDAYHDPDLRADLATFDCEFNLPAACLTITGQTGNTCSLPGVDAGWARETSLDVEWAHATAPAAKLLLVEANSDSLSDLMLATNAARHAAGVSVVSLSWGTSEFYGETDLDSDLLTPQGHSNETFVAASGDDYAEQWPSSSPNVLSVGGTALSIKNSAGTFDYEKPWIASGGGYSAFEQEPDEQYSVQYSGDRTTPDVSFNGSTTSPFAVYDSVPYEGSRGWEQLAGTSAGAPQWAGLIALADQGRAASRALPLNTASVLDTIYQVADTPDSDYANFHDVWGDPVGTPSPIVVESRVSSHGYDLFTGFGSPRGTNTDGVLLHATLVSATGSGFVPVSDPQGTQQGPTNNVATPSGLSPATGTVATPRLGPPQTDGPGEIEIDLAGIFGRQGIAAGSVTGSLTASTATWSGAAAAPSAVDCSHFSHADSAELAGAAASAPTFSTAIRRAATDVEHGVAVAATEWQQAVAAPVHTLLAAGSSLITSSLTPAAGSMSVSESLNTATATGKPLASWSSAAILVGTSAAVGWFWSEAERRRRSAAVPFPLGHPWTHPAAVDQRLAAEGARDGLTSRNLLHSDPHPALRCIDCAG